MIIWLIFKSEAPPHATLPEPPVTPQVKLLQCATTTVIKPRFVFVQNQVYFKMAKKITQKCKE